jgi:hypothetical protein
MRIISRLALIAVLSSASVPVIAGVNVSFVEPDKYTDLRQRDFRTTNADRDAILNDLKAHLEALGSQLQPHQAVTVEVIDIDLAGESENLATNAQDQRVAREFSGPTIKLRYVFEEGGQVIASAEETVRDQNYLNHPTLKTDSDPLRYEKYMLDDWFKTRFVQRRAAATP